ncbi:MAG TPA: hypothetical protein VMG34_02100 [Bacteroidota bacterium]|nr:hypothetical protein [Bacteroidota bacterium]
MTNSHENVQQPFPFWLLEEFSAGESFSEEELRPISDAEFFSWMGILSIALLVYGFVFHFIA